jgi:hypothetical protein
MDRGAEHAKHKCIAYRYNDEAMLRTRAGVDEGERPVLCCFGRDEEAREAACGAAELLI